jgi:hypothetical protein
MFMSIPVLARSLEIPAIGALRARRRSLVISPSCPFSDLARLKVRRTQSVDYSAVKDFLKSARDEDPVRYAQRFPLTVLTDSGSVLQASPEEMARLVELGFFSAHVIEDSKGKVLGLADYSERPLSQALSWTGIVKRSCEANMIVAKKLEGSVAAVRLARHAMDAASSEGYDKLVANKHGSRVEVDLRKRKSRKSNASV